MDPGNVSRTPAGPPAFTKESGRGAPNSKTSNSRRLVEEQLLQADGAAAGFYGARGPAGLGMYGNDHTNRTAQLGSLYAAGALGNGLRLGMPGQFDENLAGLQGGLQGIQQQQQRLAAQQQAAAAANGVDFQGLMPTGFDGSDASALLGNPAAMAGYPFQAGFNAAAVGLGVDGAPVPGTSANLLNANAAAANMRNAAQFNANGVSSLFDQGYNFARSEMALVRHQVALNGNAALMGGNQGGFNPLAAAGLDRRSLPGNPYGNYGAADPNMMGAAGNEAYLGREGNAAAAATHLATIPAIRLAQHRNTLQRRMMVNSLPERKDGSFPVVLYQESDEHKLTAYQCLLRKQLELFEADEDDVRCSTRQGRTAPIKLGQVGLRCRHCAGVQLAARTKGAAYYSQTVEGIYQIAQNMSKVHLCERCYRIPRDVRRQLIVLRSDCRRAIGGKEYWSENIRALGVYVDEGILRVKKAAKEGDEKKEGSDAEKKEDGEKKEETKDEEMKVKEEDTAGETKEETTPAAEADKKEDEATPMEEEKTEDEKKEETTPTEAAKPAEGEEKPAEEAAPKEEEIKKEEDTPMDSDDKKEKEAPTEEAKPEETPAVEEPEKKEEEKADAMEVETPAEEEKKPEEETPAAPPVEEEKKPEEEAAPVEEEKKPEEEAPKEDPAPEAAKEEETKEEEEPKEEKAAEETKG